MIKSNSLPHKSKKKAKGVQTPSSPILLCPRCKSKKICWNKGSTCLKPIPKINWLCSKCLCEW